ncbi:hypothetical protein AX774_g2175 [Zancudomyces culisetae]|uniref:Uncharacterized protein n=1 Tax=Zancudomyces culisetae TaxID=1213189 RepID=A0A1R1PTK3_ZANCU|nr:hypothetical protein AX774_g2175 [Zancudomyces culisetae]|eukprot:OMH84300.1 hypothetical protein AX774_g2175 [Zancudomyces culisetae]
MQGVPHHLLGFLETSRQYTVQEFETDSLKLVDRRDTRSGKGSNISGRHSLLHTIHTFQKKLDNRSKQDTG